MQHVSVNISSVAELSPVYCCLVSLFFSFIFVQIFPRCYIPISDGLVKCKDCGGNDVSEWKVQPAKMVRWQSPLSGNELKQRVDFPDAAEKRNQQITGNKQEHIQEILCLQKPEDKLKLLNPLPRIRHSVRPLRPSSSVTESTDPLLF